MMLRANSVADSPISECASLRSHFDEAIKLHLFHVDSGSNVEIRTVAASKTLLYHFHLRSPVMLADQLANLVGRIKRLASEGCFFDVMHNRRGRLASVWVRGQKQCSHGREKECEHADDNVRSLDHVIRVPLVSEAGSIAHVLA